jgi:8-oxo-dGTP pyrophosphatase MutT (NUDIX family)
MSGNIMLKVTAYITRMKEGSKQLLVFLEQGFEHLGYQVPGGTVEENEPLLDALSRELQEEAGLVPTNVVLLGDHTYTSGANHRSIKRYYYHMQAECAEQFTHIVQSNDEDNGWIYHYSWMDVDKLQGLHGQLGVYLHRLSDPTPL